MSRNHKIYINAKANIGETAWARNKKRIPRKNDNVFFDADEWKCNLFVYEILLCAGCDIGTPNSVNPIAHPILAMKNRLSRPPCAIDWYNGYVSGMDLIGEGDSGREKAKQGDIITDGVHMGIVAGNNETISAAEDRVVLNDWGFRGENVKIFRCNY